MDSSPGVLTISGNYTEAGASVLEIGLGGATPGAGFVKGSNLNGAYLTRLPLLGQ